MRVRLTQIDGHLPNLALMKLAHWHRERGDEVVFRRAVQRDLLDEPGYDIVYGSTIFTFSEVQTERFKREWPGAIIGGTGSVAWRAKNQLTIEDFLGVEDYENYDYSIYPEFTGSIGFAARGCRLGCDFCVVPVKEGKPRSVNTIADIWRGEGHPKHLHLLDNDFFGNIVGADDMKRLAADYPKISERIAAMRALEKKLVAEGNAEWQKRVREIQSGNFKVCFNQGINVRLITPEIAAVLKTLRYYGDNFKTRLLYTAWDNLKDEAIFVRGVGYLLDAGINPQHIMVYMLIGYDPKETWERIFHRFNRMVEMKLKPYPMVYNNADKDLKRFQRWVLRRYYHNVPWEKFPLMKDPRTWKVHGVPEYRDA